MKSASKPLPLAAMVVAGLSAAPCGCGDDGFVLQVTLSGLQGGTVTLANGPHMLAASENGDFAFPSLPENGVYAVAVSSQPAGQSCQVLAGTGVATGDVQVNVTCECREGFGGAGVCEPLPWSVVEAGGFLISDGMQSYDSCGIRQGALYCWGDGSYGQLGSGVALADTPVRIGAANDWSAVAVGGGFICGIRNGGELYCWGLNHTRNGAQGDITRGLLGLGPDLDGTFSVPEPTRVGDASDWVSIRAATNHSCGIRDVSSNRTLWCWGRNQHGQLGDGTQTSRNVPTQEATAAVDWSQVSVGGRASSCAIRQERDASRTLWCWGSNTIRIAGSDSGPVRVGTETTWDAIDLGHRYVCATDIAGSLWCAGLNAHGEVGSGGFSTADTLIQVGIDVDWRSYAAAREHGCAIKGSALWCWGRHHGGELGIALDQSSNSGCSEDNHSEAAWDCFAPQRVDDTRRWTAIAGGEGHGCGIADGELLCWGQNVSGESGPSQDNAPTPVQ